MRADVLNYAQTNHFGTIEARKYSCAMTRPVLGNSIYVTVPQLLFTRVAIPPRTRISRFDSRQRRGEVDALLVLRTPIHVYLFIYLSRARGVSIQLIFTIIFPGWGLDDEPDGAVKIRAANGTRRASFLSGDGGRGGEETDERIVRDKKR